MPPLFGPKKKSVVSFRHHKIYIILLNYFLIINKIIGIKKEKKEHRKSSEYSILPIRKVDAIISV